ncbi:MAG: hypothetical protein RLZZ628_131 [Bacteroidota bacterium]|jgi:hypothetical protein
MPLELGLNWIFLGLNKIDFLEFLGLKFSVRDKKKLRYEWEHGGHGFYEFTRIFLDFRLKIQHKIPKNPRKFVKSVSSVFPFALPLFCPVLRLKF